MAKKTIEPMGIFDHLEELRKRLIVCVVFIFITSGLSYWLLVKPVINLIAKPVGKQLIFLTPTEAFMVYIIVAFFCGIFLSSPIVLFQIWRFVAAGLTKREKMYVLIYAPFSFLLFIGGAYFCYAVIMPVTVKFLLGFATESLTPMITLRSYVSFVGSMLLGFGLVFEMPVVILFLTELGLLSPKTLQKQRKYAILIIFIVAAVMTPSPDVLSQLLMALPMLFLFELSIWLSVFVNYRKNM
ncbi:twin-arginine translocase subunit TatC [Candidatus Desantisbacteria bacterium]|nr:twin-arginine translocase subunit TatC [Candidatus Desantisbacteria bacterium]